MARSMLWLRYGFYTCLGLVVIGLAAVFPDSLPDASSLADVPTDSGLD